MFVGIAIFVIVSCCPIIRSLGLAISPCTIYMSGVAACALDWHGNDVLRAYNTYESAAVVDEDVPVSKLSTEGHRQLGFSTIIERQDVTDKRSKPFNNLKYHLRFVYFKLIVAINSDI